MPKKIHISFENAASSIAALGVAVQVRRKQLGASATHTAQAAGLSRVTLHRLEKGETSITLGACANVLTVLGMVLKAESIHQSDPSKAPDSQIGLLPARVKVANYPQLALLAWQLSPDAEVSLHAAFRLYQNNWRHVDLGAISNDERGFIAALELAFDDKVGHV